MAPARRVAVLLFGSGLCALVYQIAWVREFRLIFGASTAASAAVLAIFVAGLGFGGLRLGPVADRQANPLDFYARLEMGIAASAALTPFLLWAAREAYVGRGRHARPGCSVGFGLPAAAFGAGSRRAHVLMGGTLSAAARAASREDDEGRQAVALLYGVNTLGAVCGSFLSTFFVLEVFGTRRTLWLACLTSLLVAMFARKLAQRLPPTEPSSAPAGEPAPAAAPARFVLAAATVFGLAFFLMELIWYRMLAAFLKDEPVPFENGLPAAAVQ